MRWLGVFGFDEGEHRAHVEDRWDWRGRLAGAIGLLVVLRVGIWLVGDEASTVARVVVFLVAVAAGFLTRAAYRRLRPG
ncbi:MAG TPA: hypothetical protein VD926_10010 [Acidimicrobiales bacterium]|nr:hypothetical protein [Acidimicrobiales bacterium]